MAVPEQIPVVNYVADGVVKKFDVLFEYDQQSDLHLYVDGVEPTIEKYFFADNAFNFYIAPTIGQDVKIKRITPKERDTDYNLHTNTVRPKALNTDFDRLWYVLQEVFSDVGGLSQAVQDEIIARIQGDEDLLNQLTAEISARMLGDEAVTEDLKNYVNQVVGAIIGDPSFTGIDAKNVNDASGETQQQVNYNGGSKWHSRVGGYKLNERVVLTNGDIVKSTIDGNTNDPNVDMTGWVKTNSAGQIFDESGLSQQEINNDVKNYSFANYKFDARRYGIVADGTDQTTKILAALPTIPERSTFYIPHGVVWQSTSNAAAVYAALPDNCTLLDDSGYESRYSTPDEERFQSSQQIYYKTKDYGTAGRRNGNGLNLRTNYHGYLNFEIDAEVGTGGCKGSIIWRGNNALQDTIQFGLSQDTTDKACLQIATYGTYSAGTTAFKMGAQSSIAPQSFNFNGDMVVGTSYVFGKRVRVTQGSGVEDLAQWQASAHVVRWNQASGHTGSFIQNWFHGSQQSFRQTVFNDGTVEFLTVNSGRLTLTPDGGMQSKKNVLNRSTSITLTSIQSGSFITNLSSTGSVVVTLPKAVVGLHYEFSVDAAFLLRIVPNTADTFITKATGKYMESNTAMSKLRITAISATQWTFERTGAWVDEV